MKKRLFAIILCILALLIVSCSSTEGPMETYNGMGLGADTAFLGEKADVSPSITVTSLARNADQKLWFGGRWTIDLPLTFDKGIYGIMSDTALKTDFDALWPVSFGDFSLLLGGGFGVQLPTVFNVHTSIGMDWNINERFKLYMLASPKFYKDLAKKEAPAFSNVSAEIGVLIRQGDLPAESQKN